MGRGGVPGMTFQKQFKKGRVSPIRKKNRTSYIHRDAHKEAEEKREIYEDICKEVKKRCNWGGGEGGHKEYNDGKMNPIGETIVSLKGGTKKDWGKFLQILGITRGMVKARRGG